jgi:hypothetical protein
MRRLRETAIGFLTVLGLIWLPWATWFAIDAYVLGHTDPKLGRDTGFFFGVVLRGATALVSAIVVGAVIFAEASTRRPIGTKARHTIGVVTGVALSILSPLVPRLYLGLFGDAVGLLVPWAAISLACVAVGVAGARSERT